MERNITTIYKGGNSLILGESDARCKVKNIICFLAVESTLFLLLVIVKYLQPKSFSVSNT